MTRPRKNTVLCRKLAASKRCQSSDDVEPQSQTESESEDEVICFRDGEGASLPSRSAYTGDSRWTVWRREVKKQRFHDSVKNDSKIWSFFPKSILTLLWKAQ